MVCLAVAGVVAWKCWKNRGGALAVNPTLAGLTTLLPKGLASPLDVVQEGKETVICQAGPATPTSTAILAVLLTVLLIFICVVFWPKRRRLLKKTVDGLYVQFSTPHHLETVFLGELTIPYDHTIRKGTCW